MIIKLIWRNLWRNSRRTLITTASIAIAVLFAILMQSFQDGVFNNLIKNVVGYYSGYIQVHQKGYWDEQVLDNGFIMEDSLTNQLEQMSQIEKIVPRLETFILISKGEITKGCMLVGTDALEEDNFSKLSAKIIQGEYFNNNDEAVLIGEGLANRLNVNALDTIVLFGQGYHGAMAAGKYLVKGIVHLAAPAMDDGFVYMPLPAAQYLLSAENLLTSISLGIKKPKDMNSIMADVKSSISTDYETLNWEELMPDISNHIKADGFSFYIFIGILYLIIGFGLFGTIMMMTVERRYEFGMLIALGMKKIKLQLTLLGETVLITFLGVLIGILVSLPAVIYLNRNPIRLTGEMAAAYQQFGFEAIFPTEVSMGIFMTQSLIVLFMALIIGFYPLWHVRGIDPVKAMKK